LRQPKQEAGDNAEPADNDPTPAMTRVFKASVLIFQDVRNQAVEVARWRDVTRMPAQLQPAMKATQVM